MADGAALRALVEQERPHIIVPEIEAIATDMLAEIERDKLAEVIPMARAAQLTMNREGIRRLAAETLELPTSRYAFAASLGELKEAIDGGIGYPCIIKPVMSSSGKGQSTVNSPEDVATAWDYAMSGARVNQTRVIVEETIKFDYEITLLTVRAVGDSGDVETFFCDPIGHVQIKGDYVESWQPQPMSTKALNRAREIAKKVTDNLGGRGIFGVELFLCPNDKVMFSEVSPRPHDTGMVTMATQVWSQFALHARAILGLPIPAIRRHSAGASVALRAESQLASPVIEGLAEAYATPDIDVRFFGKPNAGPRRRLGVVLATGPTSEAALAKGKQIAAGITLRDAE